MEKNNENEIEVTKPIKKKKEKKPKKKFFERRFSWFLMGILLCLLILIIGMLFGVWGGINERVELAETQAVPKIETQLESARLDIEEERYEVALSRLDWILEEMVEYLSDAQLTEVGELYSQALLNISISTNATLQPTPTLAEPTLTPTPDLRGEEEIFVNAQALIASESWNEAIQMLESLREKNMDYKAVQVDGMFYVALRNRGVKKILEEGSLEPGIYDLTLAEQFAPLDSEADGYRTWARFYLTGASYWGVNWSQAVYYFEQVYQAFPYMMDGSNISATQRFRLSAVNYGLELAAAGDYCAAQEYIDKALAIQSDAELQPTAQWVIDKCYRQQNPPTKEPPTATPTQEPTDGETTGPTATSTPAP